GGGQLHSASTQIEVDEEGAGDGQWVDGRADVVGDARRHSQLEGASTPADGGLSLEDLHRESGAGQGHCGSQAGGSGTDEDCINLRAHGISVGGCAPFAGAHTGADPARGEVPGAPSACLPATYEAIRSTAGDRPACCSGGSTAGLLFVFVSMS